MKRLPGVALIRPVGQGRVSEMVVFIDCDTRTPCGAGGGGERLVNEGWVGGWGGGKAAAGRSCITGATDFLLFSFSILYALKPPLCVCDTHTYAHTHTLPISSVSTTWYLYPYYQHHLDLHPPTHPPTLTPVLCLILSPGGEDRLELVDVCPGPVGGGHLACDQRGHRGHLRQPQQRQEGASDRRRPGIRQAL